MEPLHRTLASLVPRRPWTVLAAALAVTVVFAVIGWVWPSKTSVTSSGFRATSIPLDRERRQQIKAEVTPHPGSVHPQTADEQRFGGDLGDVNIGIVIEVLLVVILVVVLLKIA